MQEIVPQVPLAFLKGVFAVRLRLIPLIPTAAVVSALLLAGALAGFLVSPANAQGDPAAPGNLTAAIVEGEGVVLNWDAPAEDAESVTGYQVLRRRPLNGESKPLVHVADTGSTATTYTDGDATVAGDQYNYRVKALRGNQKSRMSNLAKVILPDSASTPTPTPEPTPTGSSECDVPPASVSSELSSDSSAVALTWVAPTDCTPQGYSVFRRVVDEEDTDRRIAKTGPSVLTYTDTSVEAGKTYRYRIRSNNIGPKTDATEIAVPEAGGSVTRATGNETIATATNLGTWNIGSSGLRRVWLDADNNNNSVNYYKFVITGGEREVYIWIDLQEIAEATLEIVDGDDNTMFTPNVLGGGTGNYFDGIRWLVLGPGTWYIKIAQDSTTRNNFRLNWDITARVPLPNDDYGGGIWTDREVAVCGGSVDGTIGNAGQLEGLDRDLWDKMDMDWFEVYLDDELVYQFEVRPRGTNSKKPLLILRGAHGQFIGIPDVLTGSIIYDATSRGKHYLEVRSLADVDYTVTVRTVPKLTTVEGGTDLPASSYTHGCVQPDGDRATGEIESEFDADAFKVTLIAGRSYRIDVWGSNPAETGGTLPQPSGPTSLK